jgi:asparagine synthase (glutamine-hydrolysing)
LCGINVIIDKKGQLTADPIQAMNAATLYRGPDNSDFVSFQYKGQHIFIGNNRLEIVDRNVHSNQPFHSKDKRYSLTFNGAIYNYKELKQRISNDEWQTESDTEVLLHWMMEKGLLGLNELNGMFAFALYDRQENSLVLARDSSGIKPVYYYNDDNYFIASSEIKGIFASGLVKKEFNSSQVTHYLQFKYVAKPFTFYKNIFELNEASYIKIDAHDFTIKRYERYAQTVNKSPIKDSELINTCNDLLTNSVSRQLVADVPVGLFLSGGIDSTLLLSKIHSLGNTGFPTFTIANALNEKAYGTNDVTFARIAAKKYQSEHHEISVDSSMLQQLPDFVKTIDQPIGDSAIFLTHIISEEAKRNIKVALNGAGADEMFAGYNRHQAYNSYLHHLLHKKTTIKLIKGTYNILPDGGNHSLKKVFRLWNKFTGMLDVDPIQTCLNFSSSEYFIQRDASNQEDGEDKNYEDISYYLNFCLRNDRSKYLISDILALTDKMTMRSSIEARVPYLDQEIKQFVEGLDPSILLKNGRKWILKEVLKMNGGTEFLNRPKEGFGMPFGYWIKMPQNANFVAQLRNSFHPIYEWVPYATVQKLIDTHLNNSRDCSSELWSVLLLMNWYEKEF